jgi:hypothetical protein
MGDGSMALFHILRLNTIAEANPFFFTPGYCSDEESLQQTRQMGEAKCLEGERRWINTSPLSSYALLRDGRQAELDGVGGEDAVGVAVVSHLPRQGLGQGSRAGGASRPRCGNGQRGDEPPLLFSSARLGSSAVSSKGLRSSMGWRAPGGGGAPGAGEFQVVASRASSAGEQGELQGPTSGAPACCSAPSMTNRSQIQSGRSAAPSIAEG